MEEVSQEEHTNAPFPFLELPSELQRLIGSSHLDDPSRLALSMASLDLRRALFDPHEYNPFEVLNQCLYFNYATLFRFAVENGATLSERELVEAVEANSTELALWIFESSVTHLNVDAGDGKGNDYQSLRSILCDRASFHGNLELYALFVTNSVGSTARSAARGGHVRLARLIATRFRDKSSLVLEAASGGHLSAALELCHKPNDPSRVEIKRIFSGACQGGHLDILQYCLDQGVDPTVVSADPNQTPPNGEFIEFLSAHNSYYLHKHRDDFARRVCLFPTVTAMEALRKLGFDFGRLFPSDDALFTDFFLFSPHEQSLEDAHKRRNVCCTREEKIARFESIQYLYSLGFRWRSEHICDQEFSAWTDLDMLKYIIDRCEGSLARHYNHLVAAHLMRNFSADLSVVTFLLRQMPQSEFSRRTLYLACSVKNNLQVLDLIGSSEFSSKIDLKALCDDAFFESLVHKWTDSFASVAPWYHGRFRIYNSIELLKWFARRNLFCSTPLLKFADRVNNSYFYSEIYLLESGSEGSAK